MRKSERKAYMEAYRQAETSLADLRERGDTANGGDAIAFMDSLLSEEEIAESELRVAIMGELIKARNEQGITQKQLEKLSGVRQPVIARMETGSTDPQIGTVLKVLAPLGKTLAVVPMKQEAL